MAANTLPIFTEAPDVGHVAVTAANTRSDGNGTIGTDIFLAYSAGADGSYISKVQFSTVGATAATASTATVGRVYLSTQSSGATTPGTNTWLLGEVSLASQTTASTTTPTVPNTIPLNIAIPTGYYILVSTHHAPAANTSQHALVFAGDY